MVSTYTFETSSLSNRISSAMLLSKCAKVEQSYVNLLAFDFPTQIPDVIQLFPIHSLVIIFAKVSPQEKRD
jgi:hypothetical protein